MLNFHLSLIFLEYPIITAFESFLHGCSQKCSDKRRYHKNVCFGRWLQKIVLIANYCVSVGNNTQFVHLLLTVKGSWISSTLSMTYYNLLAKAPIYRHIKMFVIKLAKCNEVFSALNLSQCIWYWLVRISQRPCWENSLWFHLFRLLATQNQAYVRNTLDSIKVTLLINSPI